MTTTHQTTTFNIGVVCEPHFYTENTEDGPVERCEEYFAIVATSPRGDVWALEDSNTSSEEAARAELRNLDHDPASQPDRWVSCDPVYGSEAWGPENEYELACFEADAYGEPRPVWL